MITDASDEGAFSTACSTYYFSIKKSTQIRVAGGGRDQTWLRVTWRSGDDRKLLRAVGSLAMDCNCWDPKILSTCTLRNMLYTPKYILLPVCCQENRGYSAGVGGQSSKQRACQQRQQEFGIGVGVVQESSKRRVLQSSTSVWTSVEIPHSAKCRRSNSSSPTAVKPEGR